MIRAVALALALTLAAAPAAAKGGRSGGKSFSSKSYSSKTYKASKPKKSDSDALGKITSVAVGAAIGSLLVYEGVQAGEPAGTGHATEGWKAE